jgi:uncharacterized spore protein YtfJ
MNDTMSTESLQHAIEHATDSISVRRVFGDPVKLNSITVIPAARIAGAGGGGAGDDTVRGGKGMGAGFGTSSRPVGVYVVNGENVSWKPAADRNLMALVVAVLAAMILSTIRLAIKRFTP